MVIPDPSCAMPVYLMWILGLGLLFQWYCSFSCSFLFGFSFGLYFRDLGLDVDFGGPFWFWFRFFILIGLRRVRLLGRNSGPACLRPFFCDAGGFGFRFRIIFRYPLGFQLLIRISFGIRVRNLGFCLDFGAQV